MICVKLWNTTASYYILAVLCSMTSTTVYVCELRHRPLRNLYVPVLCNRLHEELTSNTGHAPGQCPQFHTTSQF